MTTYTTVSGDMWDSISFKVYGTEKFKPLLMNANPEYIREYILPSGIVLNIPEPNETSYDGTLPPWKQVSG